MVDLVSSHGQYKYRGEKMVKHGNLEPEENVWSLDELKKSIIESAEEHDRLLKKETQENITTLNKIFNRKK